MYADPQLEEKKTEQLELSVAALNTGGGRRAYQRDLQQPGGWW